MGIFKNLFWLLGALVNAVLKTLEFLLALPNQLSYHIKGKELHLIIFLLLFDLIRLNAWKLATTEDSKDWWYFVLEAANYQFVLFTLIHFTNGKNHLANSLLNGWIWFGLFYFYGTWKRHTIDPPNWTEWAGIVVFFMSGVYNWWTAKNKLTPSKKPA